MDAILESFFSTLLQKYSTEEEKEIAIEAIKEYLDKFQEPFYIKPQIGVMPRFIWEEQRLTDIKEAIERRTSTFENIPVEWINEYNELIEKIERGK